MKGNMLKKWWEAVEKLQFKKKVLTPVAIPATALKLSLILYSLVLCKAPNIVPEAE